MTSILRPIAEILTEMPATDDPNQGNAGPTFELYGDLKLSTQPSSRWIILTENLDATANESKRLSSLNRRLYLISENMFLIKQNIEQALAQEERL
jgi:hypothetical protein